MKLGGVIEGFYGRPYPAHSRQTLLSTLLLPSSLNTYMYAPKDDAKHRSEWKELYTPTELDALSTLISAAGDSNTVFVYALAPGLDSDTLFGDNAQQDSVALAVAKIAQVGELARSSFRPFGVALLFDDIPIPSPDAETGGAQGAWAAAVFDQLRAQFGSALAVQAFCPTLYCGMMATADGSSLESNPYLAALGAALDEHVHVLWTGPQIVSSTIPVDHIQAVNSVLGRKVLLWDNVFANDFDIRRAVLGPLDGREPELLDHVSGILINPNNEFVFNIVPIASLDAFLQGSLHSTPLEEFARVFAEYLQLDPEAYTPVLTKLLAMFPVQTSDSGSLHPDYEAIVTDLPAQLRASESPGSDVLDTLTSFGNDMIAVFDSLAEADTPRARELLYAIHPYLWEIKEAGGLCLAYADYLSHPPSERANLSVGMGSGWPYHTDGSGRFFSHSHAKPTYECTLGAQIKTRLFSMNFANGSINVAPPDSRGRGHKPAKDYIIRSAYASDVDAAYLVCLETGNYGADGTEFYLDDPLILGHRYTGPYLEFDETAYVLEDQQGVCGYTLGVLDSRAFWERYLAEWVPHVVSLLPEGVRESHGPGGVYATKSESESEPRSWELYRHFLAPPPLYEFDHLVDEYPSHLHIDIIARGQGQGYGTKLIRTLLSDLRARGSAGVHLEMAITNDPAYVFYSNLGFVEIERNEEEIVMGLKL